MIMRVEDFEFVSDLELLTKAQLVDQIQWDRAVRVLETELRESA